MVYLCCLSFQEFYIAKLKSLKSYSLVYLCAILALMSIVDALMGALRLECDV